MDIEELQSDVGQWAEQNFGQQPPSYPLVGASEEMGELAEAYLKLYQETSTDIDQRMFLLLALQAEVGNLAHSILKRTQGIREDEEDVGAEAEKESIAVARYVLKDLHNLVDEEPEGREVDLDAVPEPDEELVDSVADTMIYLSDFSHRAGLDLDHAVSSTWNGIVSERDWDSDLGDSA